MVQIKSFFAKGAIFFASFLKENVLQITSFFKRKSFKEQQLLEFALDAEMRAAASETNRLVQNYIQQSVINLLKAKIKRLQGRDAGE